MAFDGRAVANFVLDQCEVEGRPISNLALQKIVYFCHVWSLVSLREPLVRHSFEAWEFGPVLPYLYREFKQFDRQPIATRATRLDPLSGLKEVVDYDFSPALVELLRRTVSFYSRVPASELVNLSHVKSGPWEIVWNHRGLSQPGMKIDDDQISRFYSAVASPFTIQ